MPVIFPDIGSVPIESGLGYPATPLRKALLALAAALIKRYVPKHLMNEYILYNMASSIRILHDTIEACISEDILTVPQSRLSAEGVMMIVK